MWCLPSVWGISTKLSDVCVCPFPNLKTFGDLLSQIAAHVRSRTAWCQERSGQRPPQGLHRCSPPKRKSEKTPCRYHAFASLVGTLLGAVPELMVAAATNEAARVVRRAHCRHRISCHRISCHRSTTFALGRRGRGGRSWFALFALEPALRRVEASVHHLVPHEVVAFRKCPQLTFVSCINKLLTALSAGLP